MKRVTLDDIAVDTGLSKYAVSRALAGKDGVSAETRDVILKSCKKLGYSKSRTTKAGGYLLLMIRKNDFDDPAFWMPVIQGLESESSSAGYTLHIKLLHSTGDALTAIEYANAAGVIYAGYKSTALIDSSLDKATVLMSYPPEKMYPMDCLYCADEESGYEMCSKLIKFGHKRIAYCGDGERASARHRLQGITQCLESNGQKLDSIWKMNELCDFQRMVQKTADLLQAGKLPTAFMCETEPIANTVQRIMASVRLFTPADVSVVCFNTAINEKHMESFTGMALDKVEYGKEAVRMLVNRINKPNAAYRRIAISHTYTDVDTAGPCCR